MIFYDFFFMTQSEQHLSSSSLQKMLSKACTACADVRFLQSWIMCHLSLWGQAWWFFFPSYKQKCACHILPRAMYGVGLGLILIACMAPEPVGIVCYCNGGSTRTICNWTLLR